MSWRLFRILANAPILWIGVVLAILAHLLLMLARMFAELALSGLRGKDDPEMEKFMATNEGIAFWTKWIAWTRQHFWH